MFYLIHYSKNSAKAETVKNPVLREMLHDIWKFAKIEADSKEKAVEKLIAQEGKERVNYILCVEPVTA